VAKVLQAQALQKQVQAAQVVQQAKQQPLELVMEQSQSVPESQPPL
jgi:hypothetical protein